MEAASSGRTSLTVCDLKVLTPPIQSAAGGVLDKRLCLPSSSSSTLNNGSLLLDFKFLHTFSGRCIFSDPEVGKLDTAGGERPRNIQAGAQGPAWSGRRGPKIALSHLYHVSHIFRDKIFYVVPFNVSEISL